MAGYDLSKLVTGAMGTLGVITSATFRLHPLPQHTRTVTVRTPDLRAMQKRSQRFSMPSWCRQRMQVRAGAGPPQIDVLFEGTEKASTPNWILSARSRP